MITSLLNRQTYAGTGSVGPFGFTFKIFNPATDLKVTKLSALAIETSLVYLTDYTVVGIKSGVDTYGAGGTITLNVALAVGEKLTVRRVPPNVQGLSVQNAGPFFPKGYEDQLDYLVMLVQAHEDTLSRVLQMKETTDLTTGISPVLPAPSANLLLGWDPAGKQVVNTAGTPGPAGPSIPTVASAAARDALFPVPAINQQVDRSDTGYRERFDPVLAAWVPQGITRAAGPIIGTRSRAGGCKADGVTDDSAALTALGALIGAAGVAEFDLNAPAGVFTYHHISANISLPGHWRPLRGGGIEIADNVTVNFTGTVEEVLYPWIRKLGPNSKVTFAQDIMAHWFEERTIGIADPLVAPSLDCGLTSEGVIGGEGTIAADGLKRRFFVVGVGHKDSHNFRQLSSFYATTPFIEVPALATPSKIGIDISGCFSRGYRGKGWALLWQIETGVGTGVFGAAGIVGAYKRASIATDSKAEGNTITSVFQFQDCNEDDDGYMGVPIDDDPSNLGVQVEMQLGGDQGATTLTAGIAATDLTIPIASWANLPHNPDLGTAFNPHGGLVKIDNEILAYGRADATHLYVNRPRDRGLFGTAAAAHLNGAAVVADTYDAAGQHLAPPTGAAKWKYLHSVNPNNDYWAVFTRVDDNGRETAASQVSNRVYSYANWVALGAGHDSTPHMRQTGGPLTLYFFDAAPHGTVRYAMYVGTNVNGPFRFQGYCDPVGSGDIHQYITTSRVSAARNAAVANIITPEWQAWDANDDSGGGHKVHCRKGVFQVTCPFIQRQSNGVKDGSHLIGAAGVNNFAGQTGTMFIYSGVGTVFDTANVQWNASQFSPTDKVWYGVASHVSQVSRCTTYGLGFGDPNLKVFGGRRDFDTTGGGSFDNSWEECVWQAAHASGKGAGLLVNNQSQGAGGGHTASEHTHFKCFFLGPMRAIHLSAEQTDNYRFYSCRNSCGAGLGSGPGGGSSACSSETLFGGVTALFEACQNQAGGNRIHVTTEMPTTRRYSGPSHLVIRHDYWEQSGNPPDVVMAYIATSEFQVYGGTVEVGAGTDSGTSGRPEFYDLLNMAPAEIKVWGSQLRNKTYNDNWGGTISGDSRSIDWTQHEESFRFEPTGQNNVKRNRPALIGMLGVPKRDGTVVPIEPLDYKTIILAATIGTIAAGASLTITLTLLDVEFGDAFERPVLFAPNWPGNGPWTALEDYGLDVDRWWVSNFDTFKFVLKNPTGAGITPGVNFNCFLRGVRSRPALITPLHNTAT